MKISALREQLAAAVLGAGLPYRDTGTGSNRSGISTIEVFLPNGWNVEARPVSIRDEDLVSDDYAAASIDAIVAELRLFVTPGSGLRRRRGVRRYDEPPYVVIDGLRATSTLWNWKHHNEAEDDCFGEYLAALRRWRELHARQWEVVDRETKRRQSSRKRRRG